jgi:predicted XRE-type DNA-binding protein
LQQAQAQTLLKLQKSHMSEMLKEHAQVAKAAAIKAVDAKQMDALAAQIYTRR